MKTQNSELKTLQARSPGQNSLLDFYPEILRATHNEIVEALVEAGVANEAAAEIAIQVVEWIRKNWGGRTLTRIWWTFDGRGADQETTTDTLPGVQARQDPVKSLRGRELRAAAWGIVALLPAADCCRLASTVAQTVEGCLALGVIYIPKGEEVDRAIRDQLVYNKFRWLGNIDQVIDRTGLSQSQLYAIKRRVQKEREEREQPGLPGL